MDAKAQERQGGSSNWHSATCPCIQKGCGNDCRDCDCGLPGRPGS